MNMPKPKQKTPTGFVFVGLAVIATLLWYWWGTHGVSVIAETWGAPPAMSVGTAGQTGDIFGGINALFAAWAFAGVAAAAYFQHRALAQSEELVKLQADQAARQGLEPLLFHLIELNRQLAPASLHINLKDDALPFTRAVDSIVGQIRRQDWYQEVVDLTRPLTSEETAKVVTGLREYFNPIYRINEERLGPYFRSLYHVFKLIHTSGLPLARRVEYANIARSALGYDQLFVLAVNCATERAREFVPLVEAYGLLKHLPNHTDSPGGRVTSIIARCTLSGTAFMSSEERQSYWDMHKSWPPSMHPNSDNL